jgi:rhamnose transport system permease protein
MPQITDSNRPMVVRLLSSFAYWHELILLALLIGLMATASSVEPRFVRTNVQWSLSENVWELALLALPMTLIIITAGIDLSVGSTMALAAVVLGLTFEAHMSVWIGVILALIVGAAAGLLNGWFVAKVRVHPLIVTLATYSAFRGIAEGISKARPISGFPDSFQQISQGHLGEVPYPAILFAVALVVTAIVLGCTAVGRSLYAIGHNEPASRFSGIRVNRIKLMLYALSGLTAAAAGVLYVARRNTAKADVGANPPMELDVITAVVLGGTSIFGGRGNIIGTLLGILLIHETREFVSWHWQMNELNSIVIGGLLLAAALLNSALTVRRR